ncbi:ADP-ribosylation factor-binding protein GGA1 [Phlebotomus argentipes]|uniref:ADP-ribosylation factor-binding protein GGA1 n=1 Tax=Phlebotomus argentipes TaxID=94469 RepID=UPI002892CA71|nr:ADP-ribosylation factor-binding protein GGA1 [Phlebotomus argentipes]
MDNAVKERLDQMIERATNPSSSDLEISAMDAFCYAVRSDPSTTTIATKLLAERIQSMNKKEALNALELLEECMARCGEDFRAKVGTFRFLNELIKLVSRKYNGDTTDKEVKDKILDLMLLWTVDYPAETKIQESYEMLLKQGIKHEPMQAIKPSSAPAKPPPKASKPPEDPNTVKFQQLLCSKNPADIQAAKLMMVNMVKEEEKKMLRVKELARGKANVELLNDMIDQFSCEDTSLDDWALINELFENCKEVQPTIMLLAQEQNQTEKIMCDALETNDRLHVVIEKFNSLVLKKAPDGVLQGTPSHTLPHLDSLIEIPMLGAEGASEAPTGDDMNELSDIFSAIQADPVPPVLDILTPAPVMEKQDDLLLLVDTPDTSSQPRKPPVKPSIDIDSLVSEMLKPAQSSPVKQPEKAPDALEQITVDIEKLLPDEKKLPREVLNQPKGLKVLLNFTRTHPKPSVAVIVATISNQSTETISSIRLETSISPVPASTARLKLLAASGDSLAGVRPFRSAVEDITQVILIDNPAREDLHLSCTVKYTSDASPDFHQSTTVDHLSHLLD